MEPSSRDFHHPFQPYTIQLELMNALYDCIDQGNVGIFESPTGTGKSLSLICASMTWLRNEQLKNIEGQSDVQGNTEPAWILDHMKRERVEAAVRRRQEIDAKFLKIRARELQQKQRYEDGESYYKKIKLDRGSDASRAPDDEASFMVDDYNSEDEATGTKDPTDPSSSNRLSTRTFDLLNKLGMVDKPDTEDGDLQAEEELKIFYCSRTHSQLTQFANEARRVKLPSVLITQAGGEQQLKPGKPPPSEEIRYLSLGARKNLCINPQVSRLGNATAINEKCLELQQPGKPQEHKCGFLPNKENQSLVNDFRDHALARIRDIEDLPILGKRLGICPYYATRAAIKPSEIVTLPYPLLLQKSAREALDISLKGHIVIIDEAHNLMDAISNLYSIEISLSQLERSRAQLGIYLQKFRNKLKGKNRVYVTQVVRLIDSLVTYFQGDPRQGKTPDGIVNINDLMTGKGLDQINLYKLVHYLQESKLARKVDGYNMHVDAAKNNISAPRASTTPVLMNIQSFFHTLTNPAADGRYFFSKLDGNDFSLKYMLLDPTQTFREVIEDARAVILVGGTMSPMEDYRRHLLSYLPPVRLQTLSCGHVIPPSNLLAIPLTKGRSGFDFDFTFEKRNLPSMIDELGACVITLAQFIPDGLVVFFPSYAYLDQVIARWKFAEYGKCRVWTSLLAQKPTIYIESKDSASVESILNAYSQTISTGAGALLLCVIGGKMSEGINFSDALGRGVVVVGLPFPNINSAEWKARLEYIEKTTVSRGGNVAEGKAASREFYENACMRAVNQSIGRAIRHKADYATIVMVDRRYGTGNIQGKLPGWIREGLAEVSSEGVFEKAVDRVEKFFKMRRA